MRVIDIPGDDGMFGTNDHASRFQANIGAMGAVVAFGRRAAVRIDVDGVIRASLQTRFAANTDAVVELYNAIGPLVHRLGGADASAGRIGTMITAGYLEMTAHIGESAGLDILHPGAVDSQRHFVFTFAGGGAGVAANAFTIVDDEAVIFRVCASGEREIFCHNILDETFAEIDRTCCTT